MLTNELETYRTGLYKEKHNHYNTNQQLTALEVKLQSMQRDKASKGLNY
jgi:hypothetical protein